MREGTILKTYPDSQLGHDNLCQMHAKKLRISAVPQSFPKPKKTKLGVLVCTVRSVSLFPECTVDGSRLIDSPVMISLAKSIW